MLVATRVVLIERGMVLEMACQSGKIYTSSILRLLAGGANIGGSRNLCGGDWNEAAGQASVGGPHGLNNGQEGG